MRLVKHFNNCLGDRDVKPHEQWQMNFFFFHNKITNSTFLYNSHLPLVIAWDQFLYAIFL